MLSEGSDRRFGLTLFRADAGVTSADSDGGPEASEDREVEVTSEVDEALLRSGGGAGAFFFGVRCRDGVRLASAKGFRDSS